MRTIRMIASSLYRRVLYLAFAAGDTIVLLATLLILRFYG